MSVYDLAESIMQIKEDTTMSSISYLPSTVGVVTSAIHSLAKLKGDWDVRFDEDQKNRNVSFEDSLKVSVPLQHWEGFSKAYGIIKAGKISLSQLMKEAIEEDISQLRQELKVLLYQFYDNSEFISAEKQLNHWRSFFGMVEEYQIKTVVSTSNKEKDIQFLYTKLMKLYGNDKGALELLMAALREKRILSSFEIFNKFDFLYGIKVLSMYRKVNIIYESLVDMNYLSHQSIMIDPKYPDIVNEVADMKDPSIKVVKNVVYPVEALFSGRFYKNLKKIIKDNVD